MYLSRAGGLSNPRYLVGLGIVSICGLLFFLGPVLAGRITRPSLKMTLAGCLRAYGDGVFLVGLFSYAWWLGPGRNDMLQGYSMILALFGLLLFALGPAPMSVLWFAVLYLSLAVKVAPRWWDMLAWNLRQVAAMLSAHSINLVGAPLGLQAELKGSTIELMEGFRKIEPAMEVEDACSGLRMLMAFIALGVAMAFLGRRLWWQRTIMVAMCVPIAVIVNVGRILVLAFVKVYGNPEMAQGDFHLLIGMFMLVPAAGLFWLLGWVLDKMVVYDDEPGAVNSSAAAARKVEPVVDPLERTRKQKSPSSGVWGWGW
ncbi:MAG: exosortase/archaeosortase family protein [Phycisphaerales bacterium]|nr:exosortase/archaeosortase family protein [Phycisphaerales bacterium]